MKTVKATFSRKHVRYQEATLTFEAPDFAGIRTLEQLAQDLAADKKWDLKWETVRKPHAEYLQLNKVEDVPGTMNEMSDFMSLEEAANVTVGDHLKILVGGYGEVDCNDGEMRELAFEAGEIVTVGSIDNYDGQGLAITINSANGVTNVFDALDYDGKYPFKRL